MPKASRTIAPEQSRLEEAFEWLPFVKSLGKGQGRDCWHIVSTDEVSFEKTDVLADYSMDCVLGAALGKRFIDEPPGDDQFVSQ